MNARAMALFGMLAFCAAAQAKTVAWYRFEDCTPETVITAETIFTNEIDATKFPAYAGVCNFGGNGKYAKDKLQYTAEKMPYGTNAFPSTIALMNAQDCTRTIPNNGAVAFNMVDINTKSSPHAQLFIDDDEELRLQTFTLEFFARLPDTTEGFRCLVSRCGGAYADKRTTFYLYGQLLGSGNMYFVYKYSTVDGPLYDTSGNVTNQVVVSATVNYGGVHIDNDKWHHIAIAVDGAAKTFKLYVDYELRSTTSYTGDLYYEPGYPLAFGGNSQCTWFNSAMALDEVRISDTALAPADFLRYKQASTASDAVDDNTLFYFDFEGSQESTTLGADVMNNPITLVPFYANKAVSGPYVGVNGTTTSGLTLNFTPTNRVAPTATAETPNDGVRFGLRAETSTENLSAVHMKTNSLANDWVDSLAIPSSVTYADLYSDSLTVESYFRIPASGFLSSDGQGHMLCLNGGMQILTPKESAWTKGRLSAHIGNRQLNQVKPDVASNAKTVTTRSYRDGKWHHVALVYDKAADLGELYVDYELQLSATNFSFPSPSSSYLMNFLAGVSYWKERCFFNLALDDIRITRGALRPYQFLTTIPVEPPVDELARASFDGDLVLTPYTNFFGEAGTVSAFSSGGAAPAFTGDKPGRTITEGKDGDVLKAVNHGALAFSGGKVGYAKRALAAATDAFTAELFVKVASGAAGDGIMRVERGAGEATEALLWSLGLVDASGNITLKVCTDGENVQSHPFGGTLADGAWHHVAVRFSADGADGTAEVFRDGVQLGAWTFDGRLPCDPAEANLTLGGGDEGAAGFVGALDELRMTAGFLPAERFMSAFTPGLAFVIR